jgi:hypothetical protein
MSLDWNDDYLYQILSPVLTIYIVSALRSPSYYDIIIAIQSHPVIFKATKSLHGLTIVRRVHH